MAVGTVAMGSAGIFNSGDLFNCRFLQNVVYLRLMDLMEVVLDSAGKMFYAELVEVV
jgi:hypothetical protein